MIVWTRNDGTNYRVQARAFSIAGARGALHTLSKAGQDALLPRVAVGADGDAVAIWQRSDGTNDRIQARTLSAAGALGSLQTISKAGHNARNPQVAVNANGDAVAVWEEFEQSNWRIRAVAGP